MPRCRLRRVLAPAMSCSFRVSMQAQGAKQKVPQNPIPDQMPTTSKNATNGFVAVVCSRENPLPNFAAKPIRLSCRWGCDTPRPAGDGSPLCPTCAASPFTKLTHGYGCAPIDAPAHVHPDPHALAFALPFSGGDSGNALLYFANDGSISRELNGFAGIHTGAFPSTRLYCRCRARARCWPSS
jgi:hypothetical protein